MTASPELPIDYWCRPLPLIAERLWRIRPDEQLDLVRDLGRMDSFGREGFADDARDILSGNPRLGDKRLDAIVRGVEKNFADVVRRCG